MDLSTLAITLGACLVTGALVGFYFAISRRLLVERLREMAASLGAAEVALVDERERHASARAEAQDIREENARLLERLSQQELRLQEQLEVYRNAEVHITEAFKALASDALKSNSEQFSRQFSETARALLEQLGGSSRGQIESGYKLLDTLGKAIAEKISEVDRSVKEIEKGRISADAEIKKQLESLTHHSERVGTEAARLHNVLTNNRVQGEWGQIQLRTIVERAGMIEHCDFYEQVSDSGEHGRSRPDMIVMLPNQLQVIIDAKAPTKAFSEALKEPDAKLQKAKLKEVADAIKRHIRDIQERAYPTHFSPSLEYTLIFLPNESVLFGALGADPELLCYAEERKVILTTPLSLLAFLRTVACGWTQVRIQENAHEIQALGHKLYERMQRFLSSFEKVGKGLEGAVKSYNSAVGTSRRVVGTLREFKSLGAGDETEIVEVDELEDLPRSADREWSDSASKE